MASGNRTVAFTKFTSGRDGASRLLSCREWLVFGTMAPSHDKNSFARPRPLGREPSAQSQQLPIELYVAEVGEKQLEPARKLGLPAERLTTNYRISRQGGWRGRRHAGANAFSAVQGISRSRQGCVRGKTADAGQRRIKAARGNRRRNTNAFCRSDTFCASIRRRSGCATRCRTASSAR